MKTELELRLQTYFNLQTNQHRHTPTTNEKTGLEPTLQSDNLFSKPAPRQPRAPFDKIAMPVDVSEERALQLPIPLGEGFT